jgi:hypothetical protein
MTGKWPNGEIDHKNLDAGDNRFSNLREATRGQQNANRRVRRDSRLRIKGVSFVPHLNKTNPYSAVIKANGCRLNLGHFKTPEEAHAAYRKASAELRGEFARKPRTISNVIERGTGNRGEGSVDRVREAIRALLSFLLAAPSLRCLPSSSTARGTTRAMRSPSARRPPMRAPGPGSRPGARPRASRLCRPRLRRSPFG